MLKIYQAKDQKSLDQFISNTMNHWNNIGTKYDSAGRVFCNTWAFAQPDCGKVIFPAKFVVVTDVQLKLATIEVLN